MKSLFIITLLLLFVAIQAQVETTAVRTTAAPAKAAPKVAKKETKKMPSKKLYQTRSSKNSNN